MLEPLSDQINLLNLVIRKYYRGCLSLNLEAENIQEMTWNWQEQFLNHTVESPLLKKYPVKNDFTRLFLKQLIKCLEGSQEIHDGLYTYLCKLMKSAKDESFCYRHYIIGNNLNNIVTIRETNNMVINGTTGMRTWEAAIMLSDWALCNIEVFKKKKVLELGSGVGFTGITIAKFCHTESIMITDCHEDVINAVENNVALNFPSWDCQKTTTIATFIDTDKKIGIMTLDWNDISNIPSALCPDVLIGADIIYDPTILQPLNDVIQSFLQRNEQLEIIIAGVIRNEETLNKFLELLDSSNLQYIKIVQRENKFVEWDCNIPRYLLRINKYV